MTKGDKWSPEKTAIKKNVPGPGAYTIANDLNKGKVIAINPDKGKEMKFKCFVLTRFSKAIIPL